MADLQLSMKLTPVHLTLINTSSSLGWGVEISSRTFTSGPPVLGT